MTRERTLRLWKATLAATLLVGLGIFFAPTSPATLVVLFALVGFVAVAVLLVMFGSVREAIGVGADRRDLPEMEAPPSPFGFSFEPRTAHRMSWAVCILAGYAFLVAATIIVLDVLRARPVDGVASLLTLGIPVLIAGQLWSFWILAGRRKTEMGWPFGQFTTREMFGDLPRPAVRAVMAVFAVLATSAFTAAPVAGNPVAPTRHCAYPLSDHGVITCVDRAAYYREGRDVQRFAASILAAFFMFDLAISAGELRRRRPED